MRFFFGNFEEGEKSLSQEEKKRKEILETIAKDWIEVDKIKLTLL